MTLDEVRKAGRFAYSAEQLFIDGRVWDVVLDVSTSNEYGLAWNVDIVIKGIAPHPGDGLTYLLGWHHLPGCDCEYCRVDNGTDPQP